MKKAILFLAAILILVLSGCQKEVDIVTYKTICDKEYYVRYSDGDLVIITDTITGAWSTSVNANFQREHFAKVCTFDSAMVNLRIEIYLNDIYQGGISGITDSNNTRFGLMIR